MYTVSDNANFCKVALLDLQWKLATYYYQIAGNNMVTFMFDTYKFRKNFILRTFYSFCKGILNLN